MTTYLDANSTTFMSQSTIDFMTKWTNKGDSREKYQTALDCKKLISSFKNQIILECGLNSSDEFKIIITNSASEANILFIKNCIESYAAITTLLPHIIIGSNEHESITELCKYLEINKLCQITILQNHTNIKGEYSTIELEDAIKPNTCLISISSTNYSGVIHNLKELSYIAKKSKIPLHTDAVQLFSRTIFHPIAMGIDAFSANFHKMHGPSGIGILVVVKNLIDGYKLNLKTYNIQNIPAVAGAFLSFKQMIENRLEKNLNLLKMKKIFIEAISTEIETSYIEDNVNSPIVWHFPKDLSMSLSNTVLFTCSEYGDKTLFTTLEENDIIVNGQKNKIRVSFSDNTTIEDIKHIIKIILNYFK